MTSRLEEQPPWTINDMIGQNSSAVDFHDPSGKAHLSLDGHQRRIPWDHHTFLFHLLEGHTLGVESNVSPIGCGTCTNVGHPALPFSEIGLPRFFIVVWGIDGD